MAGWFTKAPVALCCALITLAAEAAGAADSVASVTLNPWGQSTGRTVAASTEQFVTDILTKMSVEEKVGQMIQADIASIAPADLAQYPLGSILAGGNAAPSDNTRSTPQAWLQLTEEYYRAALARTTRDHPSIPILFGIDAVHGNSKIIGATIFPHNVGLGATHDVELIRRIGAATAQEVAAVGIDWTFAPTVAVARDIRWGRAYESYSESPQLVAQYAPAMVEGLQGKRDSAEFMAAGRTLSSVKHFLGDGGTLDGRDQGDTQTSEASLARVHGAGYAPAISAGALIVMASYNSWNGVKLHGNRHLLTEVLKDQLGFQGFVVGDWNAHEQIPGCTKSNCAAAILAGVDMLMAPDSWKALFDNTLAQARSGEIPPARIDDAVRRILRVKAIAGMFTRSTPKDRSDAGQFGRLGNDEHRQLARQAVRESVVLLKNTRGVLPLNPRARLLVCGDWADDIGAQSGGWTVDWQGDRNRNQDFPGATSIFGALQARASAAGGSATLSRDGSFSTRPDVAVVVFGEGPYAEFEGDLENLAFSPHDPHVLAVLRRLRQAGIPTVSIFLSGRPRWVNPHINASDAFVAAWLPGSEGEGLADVLFAGAEGTAFDFTGRLSFSWPATSMPVNFQSDDTVTGALYPRGYGLSYRDMQRPARLSEDAKIPSVFAAPAGSLFFAGHVTAPWSIFLADPQAQVHKTTATQVSPNGAVSAQTLAEGVQVTWSGGEPGMFEISGRAVNLRDDGASNVMTIRYRVDTSPDGPASLSICAESTCAAPRNAQLNLTATLRKARPGQWHTLAVPVRCFAATRADLSAVEVPFAIRSMAHLKLTIASVSIAPAPGESGRPCPIPIA